MGHALILLTLLILNDFHKEQAVSGVLEWTVIKRATDYGQNVTLFCNVSNCCPDLSGWDRWTPVQQTLFIDVKTGRPNKKYDGKVLKDGYTLVIQNLTTQDLNVSYSCLYGVTLGERKFLQAEDALMYISATQPHDSSKLSEGDIIGLIFGIIAVSAAVAVVFFLVYFVRKGKERTERLDFKAISSDMKEDRCYVRVLVIGKDGVGKTSLVRRLLGKNIYGIESTDGIDIVKECQIQRDTRKWIVGKVEEEKDQLRSRILEVICETQEECTPLSDLQLKKQRKNEHKLLQDDENAPLLSAKEIFGIGTVDIPTVSKMHINESVANQSKSSNNLDQNIAHTVDSRKKKESQNIEETGEKDNKKTEIIHNSPVISSKKQNTIFNEENITKAIIEQMNEISKFTKKKRNTTKGLVDCGIWDFAGQKDYYATHQTFFTPDAIYLLVADIGDGIEAIKHDKINEFDSYGEYIDFWLDSIHCFCTDDNTAKQLPSVILVCTGIDRIPSEQVEERKINYINKFQEIFGKEKRGNHCSCIHFISNTHSSQTEITNLKDDISKVAEEMDYFKEKLPTSWIQTETSLMVAKNLGNKVISLTNFEKIADQNFIKNEELLRFLKYQHKIGNIIFFEDKSDYIILQPQWLVECFRCLVCDDQKRGVSMPYDMNNLKSRGELSEHLIDECFKKELNLKFGEYKDHILSVMERFDIIVKPKSSNLNRNVYYMPCMITNSSTLETIRNKFTVANCTPWLVLEFRFLPIAYYNHILFKYISNYEVCKIKSEDGDELLTMYLGKTVVYLDETKCTSLVVCFSRNAISIQLWELTDEVEIDDSIYTNILEDLKENIEEVKRQFMHNLHYEIKAKCSAGDFSSRFGRINRNTFSKMVVNGRYRCVEHDCKHSTDELKNTWFKQVSANVVEQERHELVTETSQLSGQTQNVVEQERHEVVTETNQLSGQTQNVVEQGRHELVIETSQLSEHTKNLAEQGRHELITGTIQLSKQTRMSKHEAIANKIFVNGKDKNDPEIAKIISLELEMASLVKRNIPIITIEHLKNLSILQPISATELKVYLNYEHSIGQIVYYDEHNLDCNVILSPAYLFGAFESIVSVKELLNKKGKITKRSIETVWKKKKYLKFYKYRDYLLEVMTYLFILVKSKGYYSDLDDFYYVPSMVRAKDDSGYIQSACLTNRSIALAFQSTSLMIPPALSFRFISYCLSVWAVKTYGEANTDMLFHRSGVFTIDSSLDIYAACEDDMIIVRLVHARTNALIMRDVASSIYKCLTSALEKISQLYIRASSDQSHTSDASFVTMICCNSPDNPCFLRVNDLAYTDEVWICPVHAIMHNIHTISSWFAEQDENRCKPGCTVTIEDFLKEIPSDLHLRRLSLLYDRSEIRDLAMQLGLTYAEWDNVYDQDWQSDEPVKLKFEILRKCREKFSLTFKSIKDATETANIQNPHTICKVVSGAKFDLDDKWDTVPTEEQLDRLAPLIGNSSLHFLIELDMEFETWEQICYRQADSDLVRLNKNILEEWRNQFCRSHNLKPTLRKIGQAFSNVGKNVKMVENILSDLF